MNQAEYAKAAMNALDMYCYICDMETYDILYLNQPLRALLQLPEGEYGLGEKCYELLEGQTEPCSFCNHARLHMHQRAYRETQSQRLGCILTYEDSLLEIQGRRCHMACIWDAAMTEERISKLESRVTSEETLVKCIHALTKETEEHSLQKILEILGEFYGGTYAYIFEQEGSNQMLHNKYTWCANWVSTKPEECYVPMEIIENWWEILKHQGGTKGAFLMDTSLLNERFRFLWEKYDIQDALIVPLVDECSIIGLIGVNNPCKNREDFKLMDSVGYFIMNHLEKRQLIRQLEYASFTDMLTGVKNRNKYLKVIQGYEQIPPKRIGVLFADINGMKEINDKQGHSYGDFIIKHNAEILQKCMTKNIYRIGGDEFIVIEPNIAQEVFQERVEAVRAYAQKDAEYRMAIGAVWQEECSSLKEMILQADTQMYEDKKRYYKDNQEKMRSQIQDVTGD